MSHRSVIETLDLHDEYRRDSRGAENYGWLSPTISFSNDFINGSSDRFSPDKRKMEGEDSPNSYAGEFEFSMASTDAAGSGTPGFIIPADELFHKGKLLPGFLPPNSSSKDDLVESDPASPLPQGPLGSATTMSLHLNAEATAESSSLGCILGPSSLRAPKGPKWRELFGALRRVKSDSGRQRIPDESLLPPKTVNGKKKFFKQLFGTANDSQDQKSSGAHVVSSRTCYSSAALASSVTPTASQGKSSSRDSASSVTSMATQGKSSSRDSASARFSTRGAPASGADTRNKAATVYPPQSTSSDARSDFRGKSSGQSCDGFTFNPTPSRARPCSSGSSSSNPGRVVSPIKAPIRGANFGRSPSGRVIVRGLDRVASGRNSASIQDQVRALRSREIRRSPERSGYSNVRVTPVLNVPVCMGPVLRGATKAGKGRLSNFRSFLTFKSKLPTAMSTAPIATR